MIWLLLEEEPKSMTLPLWSNKPYKSVKKLRSPVVLKCKVSGSQIVISRVAEPLSMTSDSSEQRFLPLNSEW